MFVFARVVIYLVRIILADAERCSDEFIKFFSHKSKNKITINFCGWLKIMYTVTGKEDVEETAKIWCDSTHTDA